MFETTYGDLWDVTFDNTGQQDAIMIDSSDGVVYLSEADLAKMLEVLRGYSE
jgi:hypothetical protein